MNKPMYKSLPALQLICLIGAVGPAWSQESLMDQTKALAVLSDTADRLCGNTIKPEGQKTKANYSIAADVGLNGVIAKLIGLGVKANADLNNEEYHGVVQEQLASALKDSQDCKRDVFKILVDRILLPREAPPNNAGTVQRVDADVSEICTKLKYWPENTSEISDLKTRIIHISEQINQQILGTNIPPYIMAKLHRCIGAVNLISDPGLPGSIRNSLPYFDRSLAFEPDQKLERMLKFWMNF